MSDASADAALQSLLALETEKLAEFCHSVVVEGEIAQTVQLELRQGQGIWVSRGCLLAYDDRVQWALEVPGGAGKAVGRMLSGEGAALTRVRAVQDRAWVTLAANQPGKLATWDLAKGDIICTQGAFVAGIGDVDISVTVARSMGAMFFGGAGMLLQRLSGTGIVVVHGAGDFVQRGLDAGESVMVSTGNLAVFSAEVTYGVQGVGGCGKIFFGGEGMFMTKLTGPGWVMLQSLKKLPVAKKGGN